MFSLKGFALKTDYFDTHDLQVFLEVVLLRNLTDRISFLFLGAVRERDIRNVGGGDVVRERFFRCDLFIKNGFFVCSKI